MRSFFFEDINYKIMFFLEVYDLYLLYFPPVIMQVFVANPSKPRDVKIILAKNQEKLVELLRNLSPGKGYNSFSCEFLRATLT